MKGKVRLLIIFFSRWCGGFPRWPAFDKLCEKNEIRARKNPSAKFCGIAEAGRSPNELGLFTEANILSVVGFQCEQVSSLSHCNTVLSSGCTDFHIHTVFCIQMKMLYIPKKKISKNAKKKSLKATQKRASHIALLHSSLVIRSIQNDAVRHSVEPISAPSTSDSCAGNAGALLCWKCSVHTRR